MKSLTGQTARLQEQTHGRQLSAAEESAHTHTQYLSHQAIQEQKSTQKVMTARQLAHEQETLALQKSALRQIQMRGERMPPPDSTIFLSRRHYIP